MVARGLAARRRSRRLCAPMSEPAPSPPPSPSPLESRDRWRRALAFVTPFRRAVAVIVALTLVAGGLTALEPLVLKSLFDALGGGPRAGSLARPLAAVLGWLLAIGLAREAIGAVTNWLAWRRWCWRSRRCRRWWRCGARRCRRGASARCSTRGRASTRASTRCSRGS